MCVCVKSIVLFGREKLSQAYEFAIDKIGMDYNSYTLWNDYANLLKNAEVVGSYAENQKIMAVRKVRSGK